MMEADASIGEPRAAPKGTSWFWAYVAAFSILYVTIYPATYAIEDELNILSLSLAISRGTVFLDEAGIDLDADLVWRGHTISKFSPFHAALFAPLVPLVWRLAFLVTAAFAVGGAFVVRGMLRRRRLADAWIALYFLCAGMLFYSRTLMAAVPAAVMLLAGASLLLRERSRPAAAGVALSVAGLFHPWMIPVAAALSAGWWLDAPRDRARRTAALLAGATPGVLALGTYNFWITGSPFQNVYTILGTHAAFTGSNLSTFAPLYAFSLLVMPVAGWAAFSRRWAGTLAIPFAVGTVLMMASLYYYRDGLDYGLAGLLPAQRFLVPASMLACVPAAAFLSARFVSIAASRPRVVRWIETSALSAFVLGFVALSLAHQAYLDAHRTVQQAIQQSIPDGSNVIAGDRAFKELAVVLGTWHVRQVTRGVPDPVDRRAAYTVWIGAPGSVPPDGWLEGSSTVRVPARSWIWNRDMWIGAPTAAN